MQPAAGRVLIVDDEVTLAALLARGLGQRGFATAVAHSAEAAKRVLAERSDILVLLSDIHMPGQDGIALAAELQFGRAEQDAIEIVLLTGRATAETAAGARDAQVFDTVLKPFNLGDIARTLGAAMARAARRRDHASATDRLRRRAGDAARAHDRLTERLAAPALPAAGELSRLMASALRSPLVPRLGQAAMLLRHPGLPEPQRRAALASIRDDGERVFAMIDAALDIATLEHDLRQMRAAPVDIAALLAGAAERLGDGGEDPARIVRHGIAAVPLVADAHLFGRALHHLLGHLLRAVPADATLHLAAAVAPGRFLLSVTGRAEDAAPTVAEPHSLAERPGQAWRAAPSPGLAYAARVVAAHGGQLELGGGAGLHATLSLPQPADISSAHSAPIRDA